MKSLVQFINEAKENPVKFLLSNIFFNEWDGKPMNFADEEGTDEASEFANTVNSLVEQFVKDNNITSNSEINMESSDPDYWSLSTKAIKPLKTKGIDMVSYPDLYSVGYKDKKLYVISDTDSPQNGDYFDLLISKK